MVIMPLYDYKCPKCGAEEEVLVRRATDLVLCHGICNRPSAKRLPPGEIGPITQQCMERQFPNRSSFVMHGYSEANGYAGKRTVTRYINGIKTITDVVD